MTVRVNQPETKEGESKVINNATNKEDFKQKINENDSDLSEDSSQDTEGSRKLLQYTDDKWKKCI